jgi:2-oxo-4-hydroxy-4-carboxy-5-ureidoimidazoline decarboxylase
VAEADAKTLAALRDENLAYEARFGFIFIVCATGKTAGEMLSLLRARLLNEPEVELSIAAGEQAKITLLRLEKLAS